LQVHKAKELELKAQAMTPLEAIRSATQVNAELFRLDHEIGTVEAGKLADLIVVDGDPLKDITLFQNYRETIRLIVKAGAIVKNTLTT
jgi:imidazolonepropionase-like amidohydrolase